MANTQPKLWSHTLGNEADVNDLPESVSSEVGSASMSKLFPVITQVPLRAGGVAPARKDFNALFKILGDNIFYLQQGGAFYSYDPSIDYDVGSAVKFNDSFYLCLIANGPSTQTHSPDEENSLYWFCFAAIGTTDKRGSVQLTNEVSSNSTLALTPKALFDFWEKQKKSFTSWLPGDIRLWAGPVSTIPEGFLPCNGATLSRTTYSDLFAVIGTLYGKGDGINATSKFGTAVFDGEDGNLIRVTVATNADDATSFDVTTYFKGSLVETQTVKKSTELVNNSYVVWDTSVALVAGDDVTFTGGTGSTFNLPDMRDRFAEGAGTNAVGTYLEAGLPNITGSSFVVSVNTNRPSSSGCVDISSVGDSWRLVSGSSVTVWGGGKINASRSSSIYGNSTTVQPNSLIFNYIIKY